MGAHRGKSAVREKDRHKTKASLQRISKLAFVSYIKIVFPIGYLYTKSGIWKRDRLLVMN